MRYLNGWHPFESIRFDLVKITMWRCLILQIWEQQKQLLLNQRVIQQRPSYRWHGIDCPPAIHVQCVLQHTAINHRQTVVDTSTNIATPLTYSPYTSHVPTPDRLFWEDAASCDVFLGEVSEEGPLPGYTVYHSDGDPRRHELVTSNICVENPSGIIWVWGGDVNIYKMDAMFDCGVNHSVHPKVFLPSLP